MLLVSDEGTWSRGAPMPTERGEVGAAAVDGKIYVVGAYSGVTNAKITRAHLARANAWLAELVGVPRPAAAAATPSGGG